MCAECLEEKHAGVVYGLHLGDYDYRYIGKSVNHKKRYKEHINEALRGGGYAVHGWIRKHGAENIMMTIIETFTEEDLDQIDEREIFHIAQARAYYSENLNLTDGGDGVAGRKHTEEARAKIKEARARQIITAEHIDAMRAARVGKPSNAAGYKWTDEQKAKLKGVHAGNKYMLGKTHTDEWKAYMSAIQKGKPKRNHAVSVHTRWHTNRNIVKSDCTYCMEGGNK